ncbi:MULTISPECIES: nitroreductase family deazaflavin-dependent oxidoreductase [unclassified Streptomyces]|uniref:nitroreductase family deazaflavin-dependent oxidoreductase n=1 Tax=unclassified Streptomyces TaxID=2593676 RepID=UPI00224DBB6E|nr:MULTISPECIES: nitroreductase family deazaflavin-dependent oxidoreductase [unclassified Streptomyces]MCX4795715.1 nitroreductase family deazaflavin-dependent oxidoreductase [Streptomyces sp. NBC_01242]WSJ37004.1 nitroreductase family deazaflavin-dependent oxidoreductase [Streptomyces sp. NBC_01321]WSP56769.1 nitroreductase family deazaflavin-dependent oxidoreductase [Streptomyces sp. NBC_01241]WSP63403.1 nitroreductase family deazaflavin-dependent oxidoreductase [Streptomyces sp. NBC_01240]
MAPGVRLIQKVSSTRTFARIAPHVVPAMDRAVHRLTRGKVLLSARMLPGLILTVPGARSGRPRTTPLACMPEQGPGSGKGNGAEQSWILVGSNFGRTGHPAWTANLLAGPDAAVINWKGRDIPVRATLLKGAEREAVWQAALKFWPPYAAYQARIEREIRLFRLERRDDAAT